MRPDTEPRTGPVPYYQRPTAPDAGDRSVDAARRSAALRPMRQPPARLGPARLGPADRARLAALSFDALNAAIEAVLREAYRVRRTGIADVVPTTTLVRLNGMLALARRMTRGLRRPHAIALLPEHLLLSAFELVGPLQQARTALAAAAMHRPRPHDPGWRGLRKPFRPPAPEIEPAADRGARRHGV